MKETIHKNVDINVIGIDWQNFQFHNEYISSCTKLFGAITSNFFQEMFINHGMNFHELTVVAHSTAGKFCSSIPQFLPAKIQRMVGLDTCDFNTTDAVFVEVCFFHIVLIIEYAFIVQLSKIPLGVQIRRPFTL